MAFPTPSMDPVRSSGLQASLVSSHGHWEDEDVQVQTEFLWKRSKNDWWCWGSLDLIKTTALKPIKIDMKISCFNLIAGSCHWLHRLSSRPGPHSHPAMKTSLCKSFFIHIYWSAGETMTTSCLGFRLNSWIMLLYQSACFYLTLCWFFHFDLGTWGMRQSLCWMLLMNSLEMTYCNVSLMQNWRVQQCNFQTLIRLNYRLENYPRAMWQSFTWSSLRFVVTNPLLVVQFFTEKLRDGSSVWISVGHWHTPCALHAHSRKLPLQIALIQGCSCGFHCSCCDFINSLFWNC